MRWRMGPRSRSARRSLFLCAELGRRGLLLGQHAIQLDAQIQELRAQMIEARLQLADIFLGRNINEVEHRLHVAIERGLVVHELLASTPQPAAQTLIAHRFVEHTGKALLAHLAESANDALNVATCHDGLLYSG